MVSYLTSSFFHFNNYRLRERRDLWRVWESSTQLEIQKNNSTPNFLSQTHPTPPAPPWICSRKKVDQTPNSMVFMEYLKRYSTKSKFPGVRQNYPPLPLFSEK
jgi:hypothetical protein